MTDNVRLPIGMYSFETHDAAALADFWSRFLERPVDKGATPAYAAIDFEAEGPTWMFHWPAGSSEERPSELPVGPNRFILDFSGGSNWQKEADRAEELGATRAGDHEFGGARWSELRDPDGNVFRIFGPRPE